MNAIKLDDNWFTDYHEFDYLNNVFSIHKTKVHDNKWLLTCLKCNITNRPLNTEDFNKAYNSAIDVIYKSLNSLNTQEPKYLEAVYNIRITGGGEG